MTTKKSTYDVFLSSASGEHSWATEVQDKFVNAGLSVYNQRESINSAQMADVIWEAMAESYALVVLLPDGPAKPLLLSFLLGAAMGWQKPVYVLYQGSHPPEVPAYVKGFGEPFKAEDLDEVVRQISKVSRPLSDHDRHLLIDSYTSTGVTVDELLGEPRELDRLMRNFNRAAKSSVAGERLLREILRLRKQGTLPRLRRQHA